MKYSFIIIAYNEERTIGRCLDSILAQYNLADYEIIVDDGSKDATVNIVEELSEKIRNILTRRTDKSAIKKCVTDYEWNILIKKLAKNYLL